jgi:hypothetical protein
VHLASLVQFRDCRTRPAIALHVLLRLDLLLLVTREDIVIVVRRRLFFEIGESQKAGIQLSMSSRHFFTIIVVSIWGMMIPVFKLFVPIELQSFLSDVNAFVFI